MYLLNNLDLQIIASVMNCKLRLLEGFSTFCAYNHVLSLHNLKSFSPTRLENAKRATLSFVSYLFL